MRKALIAILALACFGTAALGAAGQGQKPGPKVYISVDMEGIWGVVHGDQTASTTADYGPARRWMVEDVNAVVAGLFEAGASEVVVNDSHGGMRNILAEALDPRASLISGTQTQLHLPRGQAGRIDFRGGPVRERFLTSTLINNPAALLEGRKVDFIRIEAYAHLKIGSGLPGLGHFPVEGLWNFAAVQELEKGGLEIPIGDHHRGLQLFPRNQPHSRHLPLLSPNAPHLRTQPDFSPTFRIQDRPLQEAA